MKRLILALLGLALVAGMGVAQPSDGDIVIGQFRDPNVANSYGPGSIFGVDPTNGKVYTMASSFTTLGTVVMGPNWVEMASDNTNFMVGCLPAGATPTAVGNGVYFMSVDTRGNILNTLISDPSVAGVYVNAFDLDGDGTWILGGGTYLFSYDENTMTYQTLYNKTSPSGTINGLCLDPGLPQGDIAICNFTTNASTTANIIEADRTGVISTVSTGAPYYGTTVKIDYPTGDYICSGFGTDLAGGGGELTRVTKAGVCTTMNRPTTSTSIFRANGLYIDKQHMGWILAYDLTGITVPVPTSLQPGLVCSVYKVDMQGVYITQHVFSTTLTRTTFAPSGITEYGSRHVVCNGSGKPGSTVKILFSSRKLGDPGRPYQLAASFGYTNGIQFANGEYLDLTFDVLLFMSANNLLPSVFQNFGGFLNKGGNASAAVNIPANFPSGLGVPIYVSGIVLDPKAPGGVSTVGNTHWFTLN